jgi:pimeloyl-ACP methyl ester carboxylesterase
VTARRVTVRGGRSAIVHELGDGPPLLWFHGLNGLVEDDPVLHALAQHRRVVAPLAPGYAELDELDDLDSVHDLALFYDDVCSALELPPLPIAGHSFGAMAAAELVAHVPARATALVLVAPFGLWDDAEPFPDLFARPAAEMADLLWSDPTSGVAAERQRVAELNPNRAANVDQVLPLIQGLAAAAHFTWPVPDKGLRKRLSRAACPTLVLWGDADRLIPPSYAERFAALLPDACIELVAGGAHMVAVEDAVDVAGRVGRFVRLLA